METQWTIDLLQSGKLSLHCCRIATCVAVRSSDLHLSKTRFLAMQFTIFLVSALFSVVSGVFSNLRNKNNSGSNKRDDWD